MNASSKQAAWSWIRRRRSKGKRSALGFVLHEAGRHGGMQAHVAQAHARFEQDARMALREWLML